MSEIAATVHKGYQFLVPGRLAALAVTTHQLCRHVVYRQCHVGLWVSWLLAGSQQLSGREAGHLYSGAGSILYQH